MPEMNDLEPYLFKKFEILKIGLVKKKLRAFEVSEKSKISEYPKFFMRQNHEIL